MFYLSRELGTFAAIDEQLASPPDSKFSGD